MLVKVSHADKVTATRRRSRSTIPASGRPTAVTTRRGWAAGPPARLCADRGPIPFVRVGTAVPTDNDGAAGLLRARVTDGLYAVSVDSRRSSVGSYRPTSLSPSATWEVGLQSGDFTWSYPIAVPSLPGRGPEIGLSYSSGAVGRAVASTNNQPSWIGEDFDYQPALHRGRSYKRM